MNEKFFKKLFLQGYGLKYPIYVIGHNFIISKGLYKKWCFNIEGLNLSKCERELFGGKRFQFNGLINLRIGRTIFTYAAKGYFYHCRNMSILDSEGNLITEQ